MSAIICPQCNKIIQLEPLNTSGPLNTKKGLAVRLYRCPVCKISLVLSQAEYAQLLKSSAEMLRTAATSDNQGDQICRQNQ